MFKDKEKTTRVYRRWTARTRSHSCSVIAWKDLSRMTPAFATSTWTAPYFSKAIWTILSPSSAEQTAAAAFPPAKNVILNTLRIDLTEITHPWRSRQQQYWRLAHWHHWQWRWRPVLHTCEHRHVLCQRQRQWWSLSAHRSVQRGMIDYWKEVSSQLQVYPIIMDCQSWIHILAGQNTDCRVYIRHRGRTGSYCHSNELTKKNSKYVLVWIWEIGYFRPFSFHLLAPLAAYSCLT